MKRFNQLVLMCLMSVLVCLLSSCGGGGDSSNGGNSKTSTGVITGFGSVFVNGVEYETDGANVSIDDEDSSEDELEIGQVVTIVGTVNSDGTTGSALAIKVEKMIRGIIDSIDSVNEKMVVMGQTVIIDELTSFKDKEFADLVVGNFVDISGYLNSNGEVIATQIKYRNLDAAGNNDKLRLRGRISNLEETQSTFKIGDLVVNYADAQLKKMPDEGLSNGLLVSIKSRAGLEGGVLLASEVKADRKHMGDDGDDAEIKGLITEFNSASDFKVNDVAVQTNDSTKYENGSASSLALNVKLKVEGKVDENGVLIAHEIKFQMENNVEITASVESIDVPNNTITLLGIKVALNNFTQLEDKIEEVEDDENELDEADKESSSKNSRFFNINEIQIGDIIEIKGYVNSNGEVVATKLEREEEGENEIEIKGPVDSIGESSVVILGITIVFNSSTSMEDASDLTNINAGDIIEVESQMVEGVLTAVKIELEEGDDDEGDGEDDEDDEDDGDVENEIELEDDSTETTDQ